MAWNYYTTVQHCSHALMYTTHTHYTPAVAELVLLELLDMGIFLRCLLLEKEGSPPL